MMPRTQWRWTVWLGLAAMTALVGAPAWWLSGVRATPIRVLSCDDGASLPFHLARERGLFTAVGLDVRLVRRAVAEHAAPRADWSSFLEGAARDGFHIVAGCPSSVVAQAVTRGDQEWLWFGQGLETTAGEPVSAVFVTLSARIADSATLDRRLADGQVVLILPDEVWTEESGRIWHLPSGKRPLVLDPFTADAAAAHPSAAVFGGTRVLTALMDDPRFVRLEVNPRARRLGDPYWASGHLVRRRFAEARASALESMALALRKASEELASATQESSELRRRFGLMAMNGEKLGVPSYLSAGVRLDAVGVGLQESVRHAEVVLSPTVATAQPDRQSPSVEHDNSAEDVPPFSAPKPKDVRLRSGP